MEQMYQDYKDIVSFRLVYMREAHAIDSKRPSKMAREKGITEHADYGERCSIAKAFLDEQNLTIPAIVDDFDNTVNLAYHAFPDRLFVVNMNGTLAVAGKRGPRGFVPALEEASEWLKHYRASLNPEEKSERSTE